MPPTLSRVIRLDSLPLNQTYYTEEGYLQDRPILTSCGVFEYKNPDGSIRRELRLPEDVFDPESLKSYKGKPIIITHDAGLVTKDNVHEHQIGTILTDGYRSGNDVRAGLIIHDTDGMRECGYKELSLGYNLDLEEISGEWNGLPYDAIQRNIRINHLALVREARAGDQARLNIDSRESKSILKGGKSMNTTKKTVKNTRRADGALSQEELAKAIEEYKARKAQREAAKVDTDDTKPVEAVEPNTVTDGDTAAPAVEEATTVEEKLQLVKDRKDRRDGEGDPETTEKAMETIANQDEDIDILFDIIDTLIAERDFGTQADGEGEVVPTTTEPVNEDEDGTQGEVPATVEGEVDDETNTDDDEVAPAEVEPEKKIATAMNADAVDAIVRQRIQLGMIGRTLNMDGLENMSIGAAKKAIIKSVRPALNLDGKSSAYINAAYDCAIADIKKSTTKDVAYQKAQMFNKDSRSSASTSTSSATSARERMIARQNNRVNKEEK